MDTRNIDIDRTHIIALQQVNGQFLNKELPINRPEHFIAELNAMIDNPNRTVYDMQSQFVTRFPQTQTGMDYIHPYSYDAAYVNGVGYPKLTGYNDLPGSWDKQDPEAELSKVYRLISDLKSFLNILNSSASKIEEVKRQGAAA